MNVEKRVKKVCLDALKHAAKQHGFTVTESIQNNLLCTSIKTDILEHNGYRFAFGFYNDGDYIVAQSFDTVLNGHCVDAVLVKCENRVSLYYKYKIQSPIVYTNAKHKIVVFGHSEDAKWFKYNCKHDVWKSSAVTVLYECETEYKKALEKLSSLGFELKSFR